jgi:hypothetical protein
MNSGTREFRHCNPSGFAHAAQNLKLRYDPCRLVRQVNEIVRLDGHRQVLTRPLPVHPAGESDFSAMKVNGEFGFMREPIAKKSDSPATQGGKGLKPCENLASSCESSSPARRAGRGRVADFTESALIVRSERTVHFVNAIRREAAMFQFPWLRPKVGLIDPVGWPGSQRMDAI